MLNLAREWRLTLENGGFQGIESDIQKTIAAIHSYIYHVEKEFSRRLDYVHLRGQDNILRYLPVGTMTIRLHQDDSLFETLARVGAAKITGCVPRISCPKNLDTPATRFFQTEAGRRFIDGTPIVYEPDQELIKSISNIDRIRYAAPERVPREILQAAAEIGFYISRTPVMMDGRIELLQYYRQQSICDNYHRYGNLGERAPELESQISDHQQSKPPAPSRGLPHTPGSAGGR